MKTGSNGSIRKLTKTHLVVDWEGYGTLIFRMTKAEVRCVMEGERIAETTERFGDAPPKTSKFPVRNLPDGGVKIGCEVFSPKDVQKLVAWARAGRPRKRAKSS